ncbi:MAG: twin-arginine translocase subunit TatC [Dehalococcoidia bacterium]
MATAEPLEGPVELGEDRSAGTMTLLEHLLELRSRVMWSAIAVLGGMVPFFAPSVGLRVINALMEPALSQNPNFRAQAISPMENITVYFHVALLGGLTIGMPMLVYQVLAFVMPALTKSERRWLIPVVVGITFSFALGVVFAYFAVLPAAYGFLFSFGSSFADPTPTISSYIDLTTRLILVVGLAFETPLIIMALARFGLVTARRLWQFKAWALVGAFAISAVLTPTPDPVTQTLVAVPMLILYFVGIGLAWMVRRS